MDTFKLRKKIARRKFFLSVFFSILLVIPFLLILFLSYIFDFSGGFVWKCIGILVLGIFICLIALWYDFKFKFKEWLLVLFQGEPRVISKNLQPNSVLRELSVLYKRGSEWSQKRERELLRELHELEEADEEFWTKEAFRDANAELYRGMKFTLLRSSFLFGINVFVFDKYCVITKDFVTSKLDPVYQNIFFYCALVCERNVTFRFVKYLLYQIGGLREEEYSDLSRIFWLPCVLLRMFVRTYLLEKEFETLERFQGRPPHVLNDYYAFQSENFLDGIQTSENGIDSSVNNLAEYFLDEMKEIGFDHQFLKFSFLKYFAPILRPDSRTQAPENIPEGFKPKQELRKAEEETSVESLDNSTEEIDKEDAREVVDKVDTSTRDDARRVVVSTEGDFDQFEMKTNHSFVGQIKEGVKSVKEWWRIRKNPSMS